MKASDLRPGMAIKLDNQLFVITQFQHVTPGNLRAFVQVKIKNLNSGSTVEKRLRSTEDVERVELDRREMEYLYSEASGAVFMDNQTYDQTTLHSELLGDAMLYLKPNTQIIVLFAGGRAISVELPSTVDLEVKETAPGIKGATATNQLKEAVLETGLKTRVPAFVNVGEVIRVSTTDGTYYSRA